MKKTAIVVPTIRQDSIRKFFKKWGNEFNDCAVIVVEDNQEKSFDLPGTVQHYCWQDIDVELGKDSWIIPRRTDCIRSFGFYRAYHGGADYVITLDDDCYPSAESPYFVREHLDQLNDFRGVENAWVSTIDDIKPRGHPYFLTARMAEKILNHGLWENVQDFDAPTQLVIGQKQGRLNKMTIPRGRYYPMCGMNIAFKRALIPAMYFLLMGKDYPFDRFGDIWCGIISKKIIDHLGYCVGNGYPLVWHDRASNIWENLRKEMPGYEINDHFWYRVDEIVLTKTTFKDCYMEIAEKMSLNGEYWEQLKKAMITWANLF